jgi:FKBP-type peptidyl-prolyl cis-trans isomerase
MARLRERIFLGVVAVTFLLTTVGGTGFIIWQMIQDNKNAKQQSQAEAAIQEATNNQNKLAGKPMNNFTPVDKIDGLQTIDLTVGTGDEVKADDTVTVDYTGALAKTGVVFESSLDSGQKATFPLNQVIKGWTEGIPGMKVGGVRRLLIPADKAYGANPPQGSTIPANADLVFDVTLHKIGQ